MTQRRIALVVSILLLVFLVSTSADFASVSAIQEQLRTLQLKVIKERLKTLGEQILNIKPPERAPVLLPPKEPTPTVEQLSSNLEGQIKVLEEVVRSLRPRALEEETARIERRINEINEEIRTATGSRLVELRNELTTLISDYAALQDTVRQALADAVRQRQVLVLQEQVRATQDKLRLLPRAVPPSPPVGSKPEDTERIKVLQEQIRAVQLKVIQARIRAVQERIVEVRGY